MSSVDLRIELPAYSHSFTIQTQQSSTIRNVKDEITKACPGAPRPDGQRLVCRGRFLTDEEKVEDIWKFPGDLRVVHLAVHPSAWSSVPPSLSSSPLADAGAQTPHPPSHNHLRQHASPSPQQYPSSPVFLPLQYVVMRHNVALDILKSDANALTASRSGMGQAMAIAWLRSHGWPWPSVIDEDFPRSDGSTGVIYECVTINGVRYLSLATPNAKPTPAQFHALKVLSHTYPILTYALSLPIPSLFLPTPPTYAYNYNVAVPVTNLNDHLQQIGLPPIRLAPGQNANPNDPNNPLAAAAAAEMRAIPLRALIVPLIMLVFRTLLVIYFFSPSKRPLFGLIISAWILYEAWGALRIVLGDDRGRPGAPGGAQQDGNGVMGAPGAGPAPNGQAGRQPVPGQPQRPRGRTGSRGPAQAVLNSLSGMNLAMEDARLDADSPVPVPAPTLGHKIKTFVSLLFLTLYPATWDRRRALLRRREGRIRTEASVREAAPASGEVQDAAHARARSELIARHERRPAWIREYIRRVETTEWVDDA